MQSSNMGHLAVFAWCDCPKVMAVMGSLTTSGLFVVIEMLRSILLSKMLSSFGVGGTYRQMNIASYRLD